MLIDEIINDIQVIELMQFPPQKKRKFSSVNKSKYYKFHKDYRHDMNKCVTLKDKTKRLIRKGNMVKYKVMVTKR